MSGESDPTPLNRNFTKTMDKAHGNIHIDRFGWHIWPIPNHQGRKSPVRKKENKTGVYLKT
ncbi:MAG: hypothetical protein CR994_05515 [Maribacter sp.]|nr:MAG: hypothetical protein CR994_05515 [Maribacter sp.]